jgi:hypothetical protein
MSIEENIIPGKILYLNVCLPHESEYHNKYFIVVGTGNFPLLLKINTSGQQPEIAKRFKERQFKIKRFVYTFLDHDSYVDCGTVWATLIKTEDVVQQLFKDPTRIKGDIQEYHKNEIVRLTELSRSIEPRHKRIIADELGKK